MSKLVPYLRFNDQKCREAMEFYKSAFGGTVEYMTVGDTPKDTAEEMAKEMKGAPMPSKDNIMHAKLQSGDLVLLGADMMRDKAVVGDNVTIMVDCKTQKEVDDLFAKISKGGEVFMKPEKTFWGGYFGVATDKYGVEWSFHFQMEEMKE